MKINHFIFNIHFDVKIKKKKNRKKYNKNNIWIALILCKRNFIFFFKLKKIYSYYIPYNIICLYML